jgi:VPDSG-CTERM exosortase interaction domain
LARSLLYYGITNQRTNHMKKLKYIAPILIAVACLGFQHAKADTVDYTLVTANDSGLGTGPFGTAHVDLTSNTTATITFTAASGYLFVNGGAVAVNVNANAWTIGNFTSNGNPVSNGGAGNEDGFGSFNQKVSQQNASNGASIISFVLTNTSGTWLSAANVLAFNSNHWLVAAHIQIATGLTGFAAGPGGGTVPDGGTTVMLLGAALGALGMARRFLKI